MTQLQVESVSLDQLTLDPDNARLHDDTNLEAITASLKRFGQVKPIVATFDGKIIAGNGTWTAAKRLNWSTINVIRTPEDWSESQAMAYALADNRTAELADWNREVLASQLVDLDADGWNLNELGFASIPVDDITEAAEKVARDAQERDGLVNCPKCGYTWNPELEVSAE